MKTKKIDYSIIAVLFFFGFIAVLDIGTGEIQGWDEGLYAIRARSILLFSAFWDQTEYAVGGLYSSTYPPMFVWIMSGAMYLIGESNFSVRILSALSSILSIFLLYSISTRIVKKDLALMSALLLSGTFCWNSYARLGMTDIFLISIFLLSFWSIIKADENYKSNKKYLFILLFGISFFIALMTKIVISFLPLMFVAIYFFFGKDRSIKHFLILASILSALFAYPWYWFMAEKYGSNFYNAMLVPHLYSVVENNTPRLGVFYYLNQIVVSNPFLLLTFLSPIIIFIKYKKKDLFQNYNEKIVLLPLLLWFFIGFTIFSASVTKLHHYTNYIIPSGIAIALYSMSKLDDYIKNPKLKWLVVLGLIMWGLWAFSGGLRQGVKALEFPENIPIIVIFTGSFVIFALATLLLSKKIINMIYNPVFKKVVLIIFALLIIRVVSANSLIPNGREQGASESSFLIYHLSENSFVYVYHEHTEAEVINPQLDWYLNGWMTGWHKFRYYNYIALPEFSLNSAELNKHYSRPDDILVYYKSRDPKLSEIVINEIRETRMMLLETKSYAVFGLKKKSGNKDALV